jgi:hypothetical protein
MNELYKNMDYARKCMVRLVLWPAGIIIMILLFVGCGGGGGGGNSGTSANSSASNSSGSVGTGECYGCHADGMIAKYSGLQIFSNWLAGPHANLEGAGNIGIPDYNYSGYDSTCTECHDKLSEGTLLNSYYLSSGISDLGTVNRPITGCESCHGSGASHYGIGPLPYPAPRSSVCGQCHSDNMDQVSGYDHMAANLETDDIYSDYQTSPHASSISSHHYATGSTTDVKATCSKCHTDEGARLYKDVQSGHDGDGTPSNPGLSTLITSSDPAVADASVIQCSTCHDAHSSSKLLRAASGSNSSQYQTCTNCHQVFRDGSNTDDSYHGKNSAYSWSGNVVGVGNFDGGRTILDTHSDDSTTSDIEGYVIDSSSDRSCTGCHNPHNADKTINVDWANSSHGGHILQTVDAVTGDALVTDAEGPAFTHYDFKGASRQACQRCHTATGFKNLVTAPATYDPANNVFFATGEEREMLYCWACHTSNVGDLRDPGAFTNVSPYAEPAARIAAVPDLNGSNLCMSCHSGRESGTEDIANSADDFTSKSFVNSHYLALGGVLFRTVAYEYSGRNYDNAATFAHDQIGTLGDPGMGSNGPCVGCHMKTANGHTLEVVTGNLGAVTAIDAYTNICSNCHPSEATLITNLNDYYDDFVDALAELSTSLTNAGHPYLGGYPYFSSGDWTNGTSDNNVGKNYMGAAFNYNMLLHAPGAYAHNYQYTRKLIYDSIDFLDDATLNKSVETTLGCPGSDACDFLEGVRP